MLRKYHYRRTLPHHQKDHKAICATFATYHRWPLPESVRDVVVEACLHLDGTKCTLHGFVVMPDHVLRREEGIDAKLDYIRLNPVRAGLVQEATAYKWM